MSNRRIVSHTHPWAGVLRAATGLGACVLVAASPAGCASGGGTGWSSAGDRRVAQARATEDPMGTMGYRLAWRGFPIVSRRSGVNQFDVFAEGVLVQDGETTLTLMDHATGANIWSRQVSMPRTRFVGNTIVGDQVISASDNELFFMDLRTGDVRDRQRLASVVNTPPVVQGEVAVFGTATGELLGHSLYSGFKLWGYKLEGSISAPAVAIGPYVGAVSQAGDVIILRPQDGTSTGRARLFAGLRNRPVADANSMYIAGMDQSVYAFNAQNGRRAWRHRSERAITAQPAVAGGALYVTIPDVGLVALDTLDGQVLWTAADITGEVVAARDDRVLVWDGGSLASVDIETGELIDTVRMQGVQRIVARPFENGDIYTLTGDGVVSRYSPR